MYSEKRNAFNKVVKAQTKFGKTKELCITPFHGRTYVHISDTKNCFQADGSFDLSKSKSISFSSEEVKELSALLKHVDHYDGIFHRRTQDTCSVTAERHVSLQPTHAYGGASNGVLQQDQREVYIDPERRVTLVHTTPERHVSLATPSKEQHASHLDIDLQGIHDVITQLKHASTIPQREQQQQQQQEQQQQEQQQLIDPQLLEDEEIFYAIPLTEAQAENF